MSENSKFCRASINCESEAGQYLKTRVMPEWRKIFEAEDSDFGGGA